MTLNGGSITVLCPTCGRNVVIPVLVADLDEHTDAGRIVARVQLDDQVVRAHILTHGRHDGEPVRRAA